MPVDYDCILKSFQLDKTLLPNASNADKESVIRKAIRAAERLRDAVPEIVDLSSRPYWDTGEQSIGSAINNVSFGEIFNVAELAKLRNGQPFYDVRQTIALMGNTIDTDPKMLFMLQDAKQLQAIFIYPIEARKLSNGTICLAIAWSTQKRKVAQSQVQPTLDYLAEKLHRKEVSSIKSSLEEQYILIEAMKSHEELLDPDYIKRKSASLDHPQLKTWNISFLLPVTPIGPIALTKFAEVQPCHLCSQPAKSRCSRCTVWYCSSTCQKDDWSRHKSECSKAKHGETVVLYFSTSPYHTLVNKNNSAADLMKDFREERPPNYVPPNVHGKGRFIVKIQKTPSPFHAPLLMYDERRTIVGHIMPAPNQFDRTLIPDLTHLRIFHENDPDNFTKTERLIVKHGVASLKGFFWAQRDSDWGIKVFIDDLPKQDIRW